jgi:3-oxoacyl-[acyl-carrier protein] reductase
MKHKTILITGASRGLGLALAENWAPKNRVISISRNPAIKQASNVHFYSCDLADEPQVMATLKKINKDFPCIDILINNAAILMSVPFGIMKTQDISRMVDVNLKAPMLISKSVFRKMILARSGQIINILSMAPKLAVVGDSVYASTKSGLEAFSRVLNKEGHPFGIHVNNIGLSAYPTKMLEQIVGSNPEKVLSLIPHKQYAPLNEIIAAIEFFAANSNDIGGQTLYFGGI